MHEADSLTEIGTADPLIYTRAGRRMLTGMPGLPDDWEPPFQARLDKAWREHPEHERLVTVSRERNEHGKKTWQTVFGPEEEDPSWDAFWLRPVDPTDPRPPILIDRYPRSWREQQEADAHAIADEHAED